MVPRNRLVDAAIFFWAWFAFIKFLGGYEFDIPRWTNGADGRFYFVWTTGLNLWWTTY